MATWRAECWLGSSAGRQTLEVQANTSIGANEQLQRVYGAEQISNIREVSNRSIGLSGGDTDAKIWLIAVVGVLYLLVTYWYVAIPVGIILGILIYLGSTEE
jgi:hypothetical protein